MEQRKRAITEHTSQSNVHLHSLIKEAKYHAECNGLLIRKKDDTGKSEILRGALTLLPTKYPSSIYHQAISVQKIYNELYHKVACDYQFLKETLASTVACDEFTRRHWEIYEAVRAEGLRSKTFLGLLRSDYMYHIKDKKEFQLAQIELNTIASSMAVVSKKANETHRYLGRVLRDPYLIDSNRFPDSEAKSAIAAGLIKAWQAYGNPKAAVFFLVAQFEGNYADIRSIQYEVLNQNPDVDVIFPKGDSLLNSLSMTEDKRLFADCREVAVVYFRHLYAPRHYRDPRHWDFRLMIEQSQAIKCPSIEYHLAGTKKIQQELTRPGVLERFLSDDKCEEIRKSFAGIYSLSEDNRDVINDALKSPEKYVLKPQREGGGNNFYGADIVTKLAEIEDSGERDAYILMERINPPSQYNVKLDSEGEMCVCEPIISELGIYGVVIGTISEISHNATAGYLLRSKCMGVDEGGFVTGYSAIDTPYLLSNEEMLAELE